MASVVTTTKDPSAVYEDDGIIICGFINIYKYPKQARLHSGTGIYSTREMAEDTARKKRFYVCTVQARETAPRKIKG